MGVNVTKDKAQGMGGQLSLAGLQLPCQDLPSLKGYDSITISRHLRLSSSFQNLADALRVDAIKLLDGVLVITKVSTPFFTCKVEYRSGYYR